MIHRIKARDNAIIPYDCRFSSGIKDKNGFEIFDGDIINIDFDAADDFFIGDMLPLKELRAVKPTPNAILTVEFNNARFRLVWRTKNGSIDCKDLADTFNLKYTGKDVAYIDYICNFVEVVGSLPWKD